MKTAILKIASQILALGLAVSATQSLKAQTAGNDLDRDGISNISDTDVDNDGILNGSDSNIDGGVAKSGPLKGQYIGDRIANDNAAELDMDADGLLDNAANETDIDGDRLADNSKLELDIDADARPDTAANESDIDGDSVLDNAVAEQDIDGDGQLDNAAAETDVDGDALADNAANETDIDGDGLADDAVTETDLDGDGLVDGGRGEVDTDGDGSANGLDGDVDGDGLANDSDADMYGTGVINDYFQIADEEGLYAFDASVASTIAFVSAEVRRSLQIPASDTGLRVRVSANPLGSYVTGVWRYLTPDNIQVFAQWCYPLNNPAAINIAFLYGNNEIAEQCGVYSQYPGGAITGATWMPQQPASFLLGIYNGTPASLAGKPPSDFTTLYQTLVNALSAYPNLTSNPDNLNFSGNFGSAPGLPSLQPLIKLQRTVMQVSRAWYGQLEAKQLR